MCVWQSFYVLELCGHGYCVECLYRYLQEELAKREEADQQQHHPEPPKEKCAELDDDSGSGECHKERAPEDKGKDKGKGKDDAGEEEAGEGAAATSPAAQVKQREFTCPLSSCQCAVSLDDLKQGTRLVFSCLHEEKSSSLLLIRLRMIQRSRSLVRRAAHRPLSQLRQATDISSRASPPS